MLKISSSWCMSCDLPIFWLKRAIFIFHSSLLVSCVCSSFSRGSEAGAAGEGALFFFGSWQGGMNALLERLALPCWSFQRAEKDVTSQRHLRSDEGIQVVLLPGINIKQLHSTHANCCQSWQLRRAAQCGTMLKPHHSVFTSQQANLCHPMAWTWLLYAYWGYGTSFKVEQHI